MSIEHLPPQAIDAEHEVLGAILFDPLAIERVMDILSPEMFYNTAHQLIFEAAIALHDGGAVIDLITICQWLSDQKRLDKVGGQSFIAKLLDTVTSAINVDHHAELIRDKWQRRRLISGGQAVTRLGFDSEVPTIEAIDKAEAEIFAISAAKRSNAPQHIAEGLIGVIGDLEAISENGKKPGIKSGFYDLDAMTQGFQRGDLIIPAGRPSMGKTAWMVAVAATIAAEHPVLIFSLEMSKEQLVYRLLSAATRIESGYFRSGTLGEKGFEAIGKHSPELADLKLWLDDTPQPSIGEIRSKARKQAKEYGQLGAVFIDYLQLMGGGKSENRVQELSQITRSLKGLARELNCPVFCLSQLSRGVEQRNNKRPMLSDLRDSGAIEQDADLVIMLYREEYYTPETPDRGIAEIIIAKHRNGPTGTVKLLFEPQFNSFRNLRR